MYQRSPSAGKRRPVLLGNPRAGPPEGAHYNRAMRVRLGSERVLDSAALDGLRVGVVCNPASVDGELRHITDRLAAHPRARLAAIFGPQHGFRSDVQDNMIETPHGRDDVRRVPVYSLYSDTREPAPEMLADLDVLLIDLQDVGVRIYTYIYTMANCLKAARRSGLKVIVCDRPNPIGGVQTEGPVLVPGFESFVGMYPIPMRHGLTIGELARLFNDHFGIGADLDVIAMEGWTREMYFDATGLTWIMSSPNIPTFDTTTVYPGHGAVRGHEDFRRPRHDAAVRAGRGAVDRRGAVRRRDEPARSAGRLLPAGVFEPTFHKHARESCGGCQIHVRDRRASARSPARVALLEEFRASDPDRFAWRDPPVRVRTRSPADRRPRGITGAARADRERDARGGDRALVGARGRRVRPPQADGSCSTRSAN